MSANTGKASYGSLIVVLIVTALLSLAAGALLTCLIGDLESDRIEAALTTVSTTGSIISGLSLSGTAVLSLSGRYRKSVLQRWGGAVRFVLFGGFALLVCLSLALALSVLWIDEFWPRVVLGYSVPAMAAVLISTALLISSAFKWEEAGPVIEKVSPYGDLA